MRCTLGADGIWKRRILCFWAALLFTKEYSFFCDKPRGCIQLSTALHISPTAHRRRLYFVFSHCCFARGWILLFCLLQIISLLRRRLCQDPRIPYTATACLFSHFPILGTFANLVPARLDANLHTRLVVSSTNNIQVHKCLRIKSLPLHQWRKICCLSIYFSLSVVWFPHLGHYVWLRTH